MMRHFRNMRLLPPYPATTCLACAILSLTSCADDPMGHGSGNLSESPVFDVKVQSLWTAGSPVTRSGDTDINIEAADCRLGDSRLWLVTEKYDLDSMNCPGIGTVATDRFTRGTTVTEATFPESFGLSAISYDGPENTDLSGREADFASNEMVKKDGEFWSCTTRELEWKKTDRLRFFAYAPYESEDMESSPLALTLRVNSEDIKKQTDLLIATADCSASGTGAVNLSFSHALAAVTVKSGERMPAGKVTKVKVSGVSDSGTYDMVSGIWTAGNEKTYFETGSDFSMALSSQGEDSPYYSTPGALTGDHNELTLFMIPQDLDESATLTIEVTDQLTNTSSTLTASIGGNGKRWEKGKLYNYTFSTSGMVITPVVEMNNTVTGKPIGVTDSVSYSGVIKDVSLKTYVKIDKCDKSTAFLEVPFKIQSKTKEETEWTDGVWEEESGRLVLKPQDVFATMRGAQMANAEPVGSADSPQDISEGGETANCYIINRPGYYKIPLYYGNQSALIPFPANREPGIDYFVDHNNNQILSNKISEQLGNHGLELKDAMLLWQDSPGLVDNVRLDGEWIVFHVSPYTFSQGNAVIALRDDKNDIAWSWHIWATYRDWKTTSETKFNGLDGNIHTYRFPETVLGYCDAHDEAPERKLNIRLLFDLKDIDGSEVVFMAKDSEGKPMDFPQCKVLKSLAGDAPYYQWGRKDPFPGGIYDQGEKTYYQPASGFPDRNEFTMLNKPIFDEPADSEKDAMGHTFKFKRPADRTSGINIGEGIKHPNWFPRGEGGEGDNNRRHWHTRDISELPYISTKDAEGNPVSPSFYNAWNIDATKCANSSAVDDSHMQKTKKTIYDPSPAGFCVPPALAYSGFVKSSISYIANQHPDNEIIWDGTARKWTFHCNADGTGDLMSLYAIGLRDMTPKEANLSKMPKELGAESTWASYSMLTFIASSTMTDNRSANGNQVEIMYIDNRMGTSKTTLKCGTCASSQNSYGMSVWPSKIE